MSSFLTVYGDTEGPLGFPMKDADAKALDRLLDDLPEVDYRRSIVEKATTDLSPGERADISWISTEAVDRQRDVVLSGGLDDTSFRGNPIVTMAHDYSREPIGRSLWRRKMRDGTTRGIKAKTVYPPRPDSWTDPEWLPDRAFALVRAGLMVGKSIGFLTLDASAPTDDEIKRHPDWANASRIVRKWLLLEYACHWLPVNPECRVEAVSKGLATPDDWKALGVAIVSTPFRTERRVIDCVQRRFQSVDVAALARHTVNDVFDRLRGRV